MIQRVNSIKMLVVFSIFMGLFSAIFFGQIKQASAVGKTFGDDIPVTIRVRLNYLCRISGNTVVQTTWISARNQPLVTEINNVTPGEQIPLDFNVVVSRCKFEEPTGIVVSVFRAKSGNYNVPGVGNRIINGIADIERTVTSPDYPSWTGEGFSFQSIPFIVNTTGMTQSGDIDVTVFSKQYNWFTNGNVLGCIVGINEPGVVINPSTESVEKCPEIPEKALIRINLARKPEFSLDPQVTCDVYNNKVFYRVNHSGTDPANDIAVTLKYTVSGNAEVTVPQNNITLPPNFEREVATGTIPLGSKLSASITVNPGGSDQAGSKGPVSDTCESEIKVKRPYFRVYGGDVVVGRGLGSGCSNTNNGASIRAFNQNAPPWGGAGSQFAASALNTINGFVSSSMHDGVSGATSPPIDLSFGNYNTTGKVGTDSAGQDVGAYGNCVNENYWQWATSFPGAEDLETASLPSTIPAGTARVQYLTGDLFIDNNIEFESTSWANLSQVPRYYVVVQGDIYIDSDVSRLDGVYYASGRIFTCANPEDPPTPRQCQNKLTVNGAFISSDIELGRNNGNLQDALSNEAADSGNIAEVFNMTPNIFLGLPSNFEDTSPRNQSPYNSIVGLPPVF